MPKDLIKKIVFTISILLLVHTTVFAKESDFEFTNHTTINYQTGTDYVTVKTIYTRKVNNDAYYFPPSGEKTFFVPDISTQTSEQITLEREFKLNSLTVVNSIGSEIEYSTDTDDTGIYVNVPNYRSTTSDSPFKVTIQYNSHDLVT